MRIWGWAIVISGAVGVPWVAGAGEWCSRSDERETLKGSAAPSLESVLQSVREQACQDFEPDFRGMPKGSDPECGEFGLDAGEKISGLDIALSMDCALLRFYQPKALRADDALIDLSVACNVEYAKKRLKNKLSGNASADRALEARDARARACSRKAFDFPAPLPVEFVDLGDASPWSNFEKDMEWLDRAHLSDEGRKRAEELLRSRDLRIEGWERPIRAGATVNAFSAVIAQEARKNGITPVAGDPLSWSDEFKRCLGSKFKAQTRFSRTMNVLAMGMGMYHTPTGSESALYDWMKTQPDASVEPAELFRQAYRLNGGDVYRTLLTIENLLSRAWLLPERDRLLQTRKLKPFTRTIGPAADTYGSWYHFFGTLLLGYSTGGLAAGSVSRLEGLGSLVLSREVEIQEGRIGRAGARTGAQLQAALKNGSWSDIPAADESSLLDFNNYINTGPGLENRLQRKIEQTLDD